MGFSKIRGFLKRVRNEFEMWYLALDRKNIKCAEILGFGRNFCHFHFRRSFFSKNVKKLHFFKNAKSKFFSCASCVQIPFRSLTVTTNLSRCSRINLKPIGRFWRKLEQCLPKFSPKIRTFLFLKLKISPNHYVNWIFLSKSSKLSKKKEIFFKKCMYQLLGEKCQKCHTWCQMQKLLGQPEFWILAEISVIFTPDGAFSRKMSENFPIKIPKKKWKTAQITVKMKKMLKKLGFSKIRGVLKRVRNESKMWYLAFDRKNIRCTEILDFGRNFCHFHFRRSIFSKNVEKF